MEASKVTISNETLEANNLSAARKRELKDESVKALVRNTPAGTGLTLMHLMAAAGYNPRNANDYASGAQFIKTAIKRGVIQRVDESETTFKKQYFVPEDAHTVQEPKLSPVVESAVNLGQEIEKHKARETSSSKKYTMRIKLIKHEEGGVDKFASEEVIVDIQMSKAPLNKLKGVVDFTFENITDIFEQ